MKRLIAVMIGLAALVGKYNFSLAQSISPNDTIPKKALIKGEESANEKDVNKWAIKFSMQHILNNKFRMELERRLDKRQSITLTPYIYFGASNTRHNDDKLSGGGIELMHKHYLTNYRKSLQGLYMSYGINYTYLNFIFEEDGWKTLREPDGLEYISYGRISNSVDIHRVGFGLLIGYQLVVGEKMIFDFYNGIGMKKHFSPQGKSAIDRYDTSIFDYAADGIIFRIGVNIGFGF